jgi:hypothetical protein
LVPNIILGLFVVFASISVTPVIVNPAIEPESAVIDPEIVALVAVRTPEELTENVPLPLLIALPVRVPDVILSAFISPAYTYVETTLSAITVPVVRIPPSIVVPLVVLLIFLMISDLLNVDAGRAALAVFNALVAFVFAVLAVLTAVEAFDAALFAVVSTADKAVVVAALPPTTFNVPVIVTDPLAPTLKFGPI